MNKNMNYKSLLLQVLGIFVGSATIGDYSPFAIGFFSAMYLDNNKTILTTACILLAMITKLPVTVVVKYLTIMITILIIILMVKAKKHKITIIEISLIAGLVTGLIGLAGNLLIYDIRDAFVLAIAEGVATFAFAIVFRKGIEAFTNRKLDVIGNEEMVSLAIIIAIVVYGLPNINGTSLAIQTFACLFSILYVGYKYGAGYGAIIGLTCGLAISMLSGNYNQIGIFCMLGILAGSFREFGRLTVTAVYLAGTMILFGLVEGFDFSNGIFKLEAIPTGVSLGSAMLKSVFIEGILPLLSGSVLFLILPESIVYKTYNVEKNDKESFSDQNIQTLTKDKLKEFSESFHNLSGAFKNLSTKQINLKDGDKDKVFCELSETLCKDCEKCDICWNEYISNTYDGINRIMGVIELDGTISLNQVPISFRERCIRLEAFIVETRRLFDLEKLNISCNNKLIESREAIAEQFSQIGFSLDDFSDSIYKSTSKTKELKDKIVTGLRNNHIIVDNIGIFEKSNQRQEIFVYGHTHGGHCLTTKEVAVIMSDIVGKRMISSEKNKIVIAKASDLYIFEEESNYNILTGVSKMTKAGSLVSGDNYSFIRPDTGTAVMTLSDGMGTGEEAYRESKVVIDLLEQFIEVGFSVESAIKLINSVMLIKSSENHMYSTVDMSVINLYTGMCDFIKLGASTTFIKNKDSVEIIQSSALPIGMINQMDYEVYSKKLKEGDFVIMVTDGVIESIPSDEKELTMAEFIKTIDMNNPKEIANAVLNYPLEINNWTPKDDMTVLVGAFWKKS